MSEISEEEMLKKIKETFEYLEKQSVPVSTYGSKSNPYYYYCSNTLYKKIKELLPLDENDMCSTISGWVKIIDFDKPVNVEVKTYEVKDNPFCNFKKPYYIDLFKQDKEKYSIKVAGKWRKRK